MKLPSSLEPQRRAAPPSTGSPSRRLPPLNRCVVIGLIVGCGGSAPTAVGPQSAGLSPAAEPGSTPPDAASAPAELPGDDARGGRLYDNWRAEKKLGSAFVPDAAETPSLDGDGGPNGNGTLNAATGQPMVNTGHDYRLKNFFGWDLRGAEGIYGAQFQKKAYVLEHDLLTDTRSPAELRAWLAEGDARLPAYGQVLNEADMTDLVAYLVKTREGALARPQNLFRLEAAAPKNYVLLPGGDVTRGRERFASSCAACHGADGTKLPIDETESLGTIARSSGYEVWFKITNGQPGTPMERQVAEATGAEHERAILDLFAALCDRKSFPPRAGASDVPNGDPRCGAYLK